jgi:uncharacterized protein YprB with RNaseH-like and TPR domain
MARTEAGEVAADKGDAFRERLAGVGPGRTPRRLRRARAAPLALDGIPGIVETAGVLIAERSLADLASERAERSVVRKLVRARRAVLARDDIDEEVRSLLLDPEAALFVDTETTGLAGSMVFLLGTMRIVDERIVVRQVFARDYREEVALLSMWARMLRSAGMLVSFNGKAFDVPLLRDRLGYHGIAPPAEPPHLDLLHAARRRWRDVLPDCRLQTLEWRVCGRRRSGDIPGEEIPDVYHRFVRTGDSADVVSVFHHNALDLITLADIALALGGPEDDPGGV